jgi:CBS domain-containing protein
MWASHDFHGEELWIIRDYKRLFQSSMDRAYDMSRDRWLVRDIMSGEVVTTTPEASMGERRIGSLIVFVDGEPGGIVTARDLVEAYAQ